MSRVAVVVTSLLLLSITVGGVAGYLSVPSGPMLSKQAEAVAVAPAAPALDSSQTVDGEEPNTETPAGRAQKYGPDWTICGNSDDQQLRIEACDRLLENAPLSQKHRAWTYNNRGAGYHILDIYGPAMVSYQKAIAVDPSDPMAYSNLGDIALKYGRAREALILVDKAIDLGAKSTENYCLKAKALRVLGKLDAASAVLDRIPAADSEVTCVLRQRGEIASAKGQKDEAVAYFRKTESNPRAASIAQCRAGDILKRQGRIEEAFQAYSKGVELNPDNKCAVSNAGHLVYHLRPFDEAVAMLDSSFERHPDLPVLQCYKGRAMERNRQSREAMELYDRILADHPAESCSLFARAHLLFRMGESDKSLEAYAAALKIAPDEVVGWAGRGQINFYLGNSEQALADLNTALKLDPEKVDALETRGEVFLYTRQYDAALRDFARVDALRPGSRLTGRYLAETQLALGNIDDTLSRCRILIDADGSDDTALRCRMLRARAFLQLEEAGQAVQELAGAVEQEGARSEANLYLVALHFLGGETDAAASALAQYRRARPDDLYGALWEALLISDGDTPSSDIEALAEQQDIWPLPLLRYVLGKTDASSVRKQAGVPDFNLAASRAAEAEFYIGLKFLLDGEIDTAKKHFHRLRSEAPIALRARSYPALYKHSNRMELALAGWLDRR